tara:strand:- start:263 stop:1381 length:1119 start_codon:yes stop_codon:yes gene_type:complete
MKPRTRNTRNTAVITDDAAGGKYARYDADQMSKVFGETRRYTRSEPLTVESGTTIYGPGAGAAKARRGDSTVTTRSERIEIASISYDDAVDNAEMIMGGPNSDAADEWDGQSLDDFMERRFSVDYDAVAASQLLFDQISAELDLSTIEQRLESAPVGGSPRVGAFLAGSPNSMNRIVSPLTTDGPVQLYADLTSSAGYSSALLRERGIAILTLARVIQLTRPVELHVVSACQVVPPFNSGRNEKTGQTNTAVAMQVATAPFDPSTAARALCDPFVSRGLAYNLQRSMGGVQPGRTTTLLWSPIPLKAMFDIQPDRDVVIGPAHLGEQIGETISPLDWVKKQFLGWLENAGHSNAAVSMAEKWGNGTEGDAKS